MKKFAMISAICASAMVMTVGIASAHDLPGSFAPCDSAISIFPYGSCVPHGHFYYYGGAGNHSHMGILSFPSDSPKASQAPVAEAPKAVEAPKAAAPKANTPKVAAPKVNTPKATAPKAAAPKADAPKADAPKADAHKQHQAPKAGK